MTAVCRLPWWTGLQRNDTIAYINDILLAAVNGSSAIFAIFGNLAIIATIIKTPRLQKPSNILLCSLAFADLLAGVAAQPLFVVWRLFLQRAQKSCLHQILIFDVYHTFKYFAVGLSFANIVLISFDRHYALSKPLEYIVKVTKSGNRPQAGLLLPPQDSSPAEPEEAQIPPCREVSFFFYW